MLAGGHGMLEDNRHALRQNLTGNLHSSLMQPGSSCTWWRCPVQLDLAPPTIDIYPAGGWVWVPPSW